MANEFKHLKQSQDEYTVITVYGGAPVDEQERWLRHGVDVVVGTTGRTLDHIERKNLRFRNLECIVLDEADQMLNMGFQEDVEKV